MMLRIFLPLFIIFCLVAAPAAAAEVPAGGPGEGGNGRIAFFPFENFSGNEDALTKTVPPLQAYLAGRGIQAVDESRVQGLLLKERIRFSGYVPRELGSLMGRELGVSAVLTGCVVTFSESENPSLAILARLIDAPTGQILWAQYASATGDDFTTILGLGRIQTMDELLPRVIERLFANFSMTPPQKLKEATYTVAVMPFLNKGEKRDAGSIAMYMFLAELLKNPRFIPVEYGNVRNSIVDHRVRSKGELDFENMKALSESLGIDGFLVGTVERYPKEAIPTVPPEVSLTSRLIDARGNRIVWYDSYQMNGDRPITIFDWGKLRAVDMVAYRVVSKLVERMEKTEWY